MNEKGKLGVGILSAVLITTVIMVPVSIFSDRAIRGNESGYVNPIQTWGYDDQISSTGKKMNDYMGITKNLTTNIYGGQNVLSGEPSLLLNSNYHTMEDDIQILDGVANSEQGLGYSSTTWVGKDNSLTPLKAEINGVMLDPTNDKEKKNYANSGMQSTLNIHMKVPKNVANSITISPNGPTVNTELASNYYSNINKAGYADDFAIQLGFFNYLATSNEANDVANDVVLPGTKTSSLDNFDIKDLQAMEKVYNDITKTQNSLWDAVEAQESSTSSYSIKIDGTGTNTGLIEPQVEKFRELVNSLLNKNINFYYDLVNGGSGEGWKVSLADGGEQGSDARQDAFLGTQSRFSKNSEYTKEFWGYEETSYSTTNDNTVYNDPTKKTNGQVIGLTAGIDLTTFFIKKDMTFEFNITTSEAAKAIDPNAIITKENHNITSFKINKQDYKYGESIKVHPTGFTSEGGRQAYEFGNSWSNLILTGLITAKIV